MTKQDIIREGIARFLSKQFTEVREEALDDDLPSLRVITVMPDSEDVTELVCYLHDNDVVLKVECGYLSLDDKGHLVSVRCPCEPLMEEVIASKL